MSRTYRCIYCGEPLTDQTRNEHIILNSLNGSLKSKEIVCDSCNSFFTEGEDDRGGIDQIFIEVYMDVIADLGISATPYLDSTEKDKASAKVKIGEYGKPEIRGSVEVTPLEKDKGHYKVHITAPTDEAFMKMAISAGVKKEDARKFLAEANREQKWIDGVGYNARVGGGDVFACAAKMIFNYLAFCTKDEGLAHNLCFDSIRNFIRHGPYEKPTFNVEVQH
jgi:hypothetical protein